jgi:uncharacterized protein (TIGR03086 family)
MTAQPSTDELPALFLSAVREFSARVHGIGESQWSDPTPDTEWSVADLVDHLVSEHRWFPPLMHGLDLAAAEEVVAGARSLPVDGGVGANLAESWDEAAAASCDAVVEPGALSRTVELSRGRTPSDQYVLEMTLDLIIHAWDLGAAIGHEASIDAALAEFGYEQARSWGDVSESGYFAKPVEVPDDAPAIDRLLGLTGRDPNWRR